MIDYRNSLVARRDTEPRRLSTLFPKSGTLFLDRASPPRVFRNTSKHSLPLALALSSSRSFKRQTADNNVVLPRCITRAGEARGWTVAADCKSCNANEILQIRFPGGIFR